MYVCARKVVPLKYLYYPVLGSQKDMCLRTNLGSVLRLLALETCVGIADRSASGSVLAVALLADRTWRRRLACDGPRITTHSNLRI